MWNEWRESERENFINLSTFNGSNGVYTSTPFPTISNCLIKLEKNIFKIRLNIFQLQHGQTTAPIIFNIENENSIIFFLIFQFFWLFCRVWMFVSTLLSVGGFFWLYILSQWLFVNKRGNSNIVKLSILFLYFWVLFFTFFSIFFVNNAIMFFAYCWRRNRER